MLLIGRKLNEKILVGDITITVCHISTGKVRLGIDAPPHVKILRDDLATPEQLAGGLEARDPARTPKALGLSNGGPL